MKKINKIKSVIIALFIVCTGTLFSCEKNSRDTSDIVIEHSTEDIEGNDNQQETVSGDIYVYVTGRVHKPGVYKVDEGSRLFQVIELAEGFLDDADVESINLADKVYDGMKVIVYSKSVVDEGENTGSQSGDNISGKVNINTADIDELMTLPGIGEAKARSILEYRDEVGLFEDIEDIMNISGIKEGAFNKIKDLITV